MLLSLISVLVLLVIAFYALWIGATGRVGGNEGAELSVGGRVLVIGFALIAFGVAYVVYRQPSSEGTLTASSAPATPSNPPESRGLKVAETTILDPGVDADAKPAAVAAKAEPEPEAETPAAETPAPPVKAATSVATPVAPASAASAVVVSEEDEGLSAGAALLEAQARLPRRRIADATPVTTTTTKTAVVVASPSAATSRLVEVDQPLATPRALKSTSKSALGSTARSTGSTRTRLAGSPLTLHVQNALGSSQQREQLTLSIEGLAVADIDVDDSRPSVSVAVPLPRPGLLHYRLQGISEGDGTTQVVGEGCIRVRDGARFVVRRKEGSRKVFLEQQALSRSAG